MFLALLTTSRSSRSHQQKYKSTSNLRKNALLFLSMLSTFTYLLVSFYMQWKTSFHCSTSSVRAIKLRSQQQEMFSTTPFDLQSQMSSRQIGRSSSASGVPSKQGCLIMSSSFNLASRQTMVLLQISSMSCLRLAFWSSTGTVLTLTFLLISLMQSDLTCASVMDQNHALKRSYICSRSMSPLVNIFLKNSNLELSPTIQQYSSYRKRERESAPISMMARANSYLYFCWLGSISLKLLMQLIQRSKLLGLRLRAVRYSSNLVSWMYSAQCRKLKGKDSRKCPSSRRQPSDWLQRFRYSSQRRQRSPKLQCSIYFRKMLRPELIIIQLMNHSPKKHNFYIADTKLSDCQNLGGSVCGLTLNAIAQLNEIINYLFKAFLSPSSFLFQLMFQ